MVDVVRVGHFLKLMPGLDFGFLDFVIGFKHVDDVFNGAKYSLGCFFDGFDNVHGFPFPHIGVFLGIKNPDNHVATGSSFLLILLGL